MPVLDLQVKVVDGLIVFKYYEKKVSTKFVIPERSTHPDRMKKATLIQECVRRMLNCCPRLPQEERIMVLDNYAAKLRRSGYDERFRAMVILTGCQIYVKKMKEGRKEGGRNVYRNKDEMVKNKKE